MLAGCSPAFTPTIAPFGWTFTIYCGGTVAQLIAALDAAGATTAHTTLIDGHRVTGVATALPFPNDKLRASYPNGIPASTILAIRSLTPETFAGRLGRLEVGPR